MKKTLKEIFEQYQIYNDKGQLVPLMESELGKELFGEVNELNKSDVSGNEALRVALPSDKEIETLLEMEIDGSDLIKKYSDKEKDLVRAGFRTGAKAIRDEINERRQ